MQHCVTTAEGKSSTSEIQTLKVQRDEQCNALIMAQDSAIVQLLLEICLPNEQDKEVGTMLCRYAVCKIAAGHWQFSNHFE